MQDIPRHCPVLDSSTESTHLDDYHKAVCKCAIRLRLSLCPDRLFANGKVKLGEFRRASYGVVGVQASKTQLSLLCLVVVLPISANGAVYRQRCMQTQDFSLGLVLEPRFRPGRSVPFRQVRISRSFVSLDMNKSVRKNEGHKRDVGMQ
jgi:hypothetical protein